MQATGTVEILTAPPVIAKVGLKVPVTDTMKVILRSCWLQRARIGMSCKETATKTFSRPIQDKRAAFQMYQDKKVYVLIRM